MDDFVNRKHAYLIMAHTNFEQLRTLIELLDYPQNDIYLHVDKRATSFRPNNIKVHHSDLILVDRIRVNWGGHSQIQCELNLLRSSAKKHYQYYHLLSGIDLPLKSQKEIHAFFDRYFPHNFIGFDAAANKTGSFLSRIGYYHFFWDAIGRNTGLYTRVLGKLETWSLRFQEKIGFHRKQYIPAYKGHQWFSITDDLVQYILSQEDLIRKQFYYSLCADEVFLQSLAMTSPFCETIIDNTLRAIDWKRGGPYVYRQDDIDDLLSSDSLFARKFDCRIDQYAIDKVVAHLTQNV